MEIQNEIEEVIMTRYGFLQRFQVSVWPESVPWALFEKTVDPRLDEEIGRVYKWLDGLTFNERGWSANRANALKSTGPKSLQGKQRISRRPESVE